MIQNPSDTDPFALSDVESQIAGQVAECTAGAWEVDDERLREVARAVDYYVTVEQGAESVDSRSLALLTSQALAGVGDSGLATRLLVHGTGLLRPAVWEIRHGQAMWTLDLRQLAVDDSAAIELIVFSCLTALLRGIASIWDATSGSGVLGIRNLDDAAGALVGGDARRQKRVAEMAEEMVRWCRFLMAYLRRERGWQAAPEVVRLEVR